MNKNKSFTLIELLVVIVIIGILAGVITISTSNNIAKARDSKVSSAILGINKLLKTYSMDTFPIETTPCNIKTGCTNLKSKIDIPNIDQDIYYKTSSSGNFFVIYANKPSDTSLSFEINSNIEKVKEVPSFDNLVAYYPLSIGTNDGNAISDMSPNSNHGTNNGATFTEGVDGNINTGMKFDGVDDIIIVNFDNPAEFSVFCWVKINSDDGWIINKRDNVSDNQWQLYHYQGYLGAALYPGSTSAVASTGKNNIIGQGWKYVGFITNGINGGYLKLFSDGVLIDETKLIGNMKLGSREMIIGKAGWGNLFLNGSIDGVRIYNRALSEKEVKLLYNNSK